jgi:hypothetical protein
VPLDEQLLPNPALKPWYDRVTWLFVSRNFKNDPKDLEALRTHERFGISSWPQMIVFDPIDDRVLLDPPRDLPGFVRAFERSVAQIGERAKGHGVTDALRAVRDPDGDDVRPFVERLEDVNPVRRAIALEEIAAASDVDAKVLERVAAILARKDEDVVVYLRAMRVLGKRDPAAVLARAEDLLAIDNDPLRYEVLDLVKAHPQPALAPLLNRLFANAGESVRSRNPNVLRIRIAPCLAAAGDVASIDVLAPIAKAAVWRNGLTRIAVQTLVALAARHPDERARVDAILMESFPRAVDATDAQNTRSCLSLTGSVVESLSALRPGWKAPALPKTWDAETRAAFLLSVAK